MNCIAIIPARMGSSRFPGKPMAEILGIPMIGHVFKRTAMAKTLTGTYVATCDQEIYDYVESDNGKAVMTSDKHERASDRAAEAVEKIEQELNTNVDIVAMIQGDEPFVTPEMIEKALAWFEKDKEVQIVNLMTSIHTDEEFESPNDVKVVVDRDNNALYFSREPIPSRKMGKGGAPRLKQTGLIFFRKEYLIKFNSMEQTPLEIAESVDMMRVLENGDRVQMVLTKDRLIGVDTPEDLTDSEAIMKDDELFKLYAK